MSFLTFYSFEYPIGSMSFKKLCLLYEILFIIITTSNASRCYGVLSDFILLIHARILKDPVIKASNLIPLKL